MNDLPEPLTPPDCDLRDFQFMPLDVVRFSQSDLVALEDPAAVLANTLLWCASWHSLPAASLTDDDRVLARLSGYGRGLAEWEAIRAGALRGWVKCSDGRLYHPVVAEKARDAWAGKLKQRYRTLCATVRKHNERNPNDKIEPPDFDAWNDGGRPSNVTRDKDGTSRVTLTAVTRKKPSSSRSGHAKNRSKGEGEGEGEGYIVIEEPTGSSRPPAVGSVSDAFAAYEAMRREIVQGARPIQLSADRRRKLASRLSEIGGPEQWAHVLDAVRRSPFLRGETSRNGLVATIDWLIEPRNLRKVMEGNYDDNPDGSNVGGGRGSGVRPSAAQSIAAARRLIGPQ